MAHGDAHYIFYATSHDGLVVARIEFSKTAAGYQLRAGALTDASSSSYTDFGTTTTITGTAFHKVEIEWKAATAPGANNGVLTMWVDGTQANTLTNLDNDTRRVDGAQLGAVYGIDTGTRGTEYFDAFVSRRNTYIGFEEPGGVELVRLDAPVVQEQPYGGSKVLALPVMPKKAFVPELNPHLDPLVGTSITYTYDPLNRLTGASYSDGTYYTYTYDAVGNRLTETTQAGTVNYVYDAANRLTSVGGVSYTWDNNGNLLSDGTSTYVYDHANRLKSVVQAANTYTYTYNGYGNRVAQVLNGGAPTRYVLDQAAGLVQVLSDWTYTYLYGNERLAQQSTGGREYFLGDALGSVRQLVDSTGEITLTRSYKPFGEVLSSQGSGVSIYGYTGEHQDSYIKLVNLRSRQYSPYTWPAGLQPGAIGPLTGIVVIATARTGLGDRIPEGVKNWQKYNVPLDFDNFRTLPSIFARKYFQFHSLTERYA